MREKEPAAEADRRVGVEVHYAPLPEACGGAVVQRRGDTNWIVIDPRQSPTEERCRLAHELVHLDRGTSWRCRYSPLSWDVMVAREEMRVDEEVADWLVPREELWILVGDMVAAGQDVTTREIAEEFQVTRAVARVALDRLARNQHLGLAG